MLVHYDPEKELMVSCDASPYVIGEVLAHVMEGGSDKPILRMPHEHSHQQREAKETWIKKH